VGEGGRRYGQVHVLRVRWRSLHARSRRLLCQCCLQQKHYTVVQNSVSA
jgi:hypothetical protein